MDKSHSIKIKINGEERSPNEKEKSNDESIEEIMIQNLNEQVKAEQEIASTNQEKEKEKEEEFNWLLPDEDDIFKEDPKVVTFNKKKKNQSSVSSKKTYSEQSSIKKNLTFPLKQFIAIIILAIIIGVSFGYIALNLLSNKEMPEAVNGSNEQLESSDNNIPVSKGKEANNDNEPAPAKNTASTATLNLYAVQIGKFSSKSGAEKTINDLKEKGFAAALFKENSSFFVFAGLGKEKAETDSLSLLIKEEGIDAWGGKNITPELSAEKDAEKLAEAVESLTSMAAMSINEEKIDSVKIKKLAADINSFDEKENKEKESLQKVISLLKNSNYKENGWKAQQELLNIINK